MSATIVQANRPLLIEADLGADNAGLNISHTSNALNSDTYIPLFPIGLVDIDVWRYRYDFSQFMRRVVFPQKKNFVKTALQNFNEYIASECLIQSSLEWVIDDVIASQNYGQILAIPYIGERKILQSMRNVPYWVCLDRKSISVHRSDRNVYIGAYYFNSNWGNTFQLNTVYYDANNTIISTINPDAWQYASTQVPMWDDDEPLAIKMIFLDGAIINAPANAVRAVCFAANGDDFDRPLAYRTETFEITFDGCNFDTEHVRLVWQNAWGSIDSHTFSTRITSSVKSNSTPVRLPAEYVTEMFEFGIYNPSVSTDPMLPYMGETVRTIEIEVEATPEEMSWMRYIGTGGVVCIGGMQLDPTDDWYDSARPCLATWAEAFEFDNSQQYVSNKLTLTFPSSNNITI